MRRKVRNGVFISAAIVLVLGIAVIVNQNGGFGEHLGPQAALESIEATADDVPEAVDTSASEAAVPAAQAIAEDAAAGAAEDAAENAVEDAATDVPASTVRVADEVGAQTGIAANETGKAPSGPQAANAETPADYQQIVTEISDSGYRESVSISDQSFCVVREETAATAPIEDEAWYKEANASGYEVILEQAGDTEGTTKVSYRITTSEQDIWSVVDATNESGEVAIAEPEYIYTVSVEGDASESADAESPSYLATSLLQTTNPDSAKQWYLTDQNAEAVWANSQYGDTTGEGAVVAVIDTGVDYTHSDLSNNIWLNTAELTGQEGIDDDGNGYVDDIYGINLIDPYATPQDDHGHGTHVAGIIAMEDNGVGGIGLAYNAKIMVIKAGGSDGSFNSSDIAKAIMYASRNGADVINMSFGGAGHSAIVENALQDAFSNCVLVAAAGNDSMPTADGMGYNCYPAAYTYVIGVMAYDSNGDFAAYSNFDFRANYGAEYEVAAPGSGIYSTLPGDRYASWNGTSMAAPVVSACAAILRSSHPDKNVYSSRYIMGQIASGTDDTITLRNSLGVFTYSKLNLSDSLSKAPKPNISINEIYVFDSPEISEANNGDGLIQPGETIDFAVGLRNQWGAATDVNLTIDASSTGGVANPYVEYVSGKVVPIDDIGTFGTMDNGFVCDDNGVVIGVTKPVRVKISEDAPNDLNINFLLNYTARNALDANDQTVYTQKQPSTYVISVVKGILLEGRITADTTWTKDNYYIVKNSVFIPRGVTVTVEPGTQIQFYASDQSSVYADTYMPLILVDGRLEVKGSASEPVKMFPGKDFESYQVELYQENGGIINLSYVDIINPYVDIQSGDHVSFQQDYDQSYYRYFDPYTSSMEVSCRGSHVSVAEVLSNSKFKDFRGISLWDYAWVYGCFDTCLFDNCQISFDGIQARNCAFLNNQGRYEDPWSGTLQYFTSRLNNVGDQYRLPQYTTATTVHMADGKKYVAYQFDCYYFEGTWENGVWRNNSLANFQAIERALEAKGGRIAQLNMDDEASRNVVIGMYDELAEYDKDTYHCLLSGYYYDSNVGSLVSSDGSAVPASLVNSYVGNFSKDNPFMCYIEYLESWSEWDEETQQTVSRESVWAFNSSGYSQINEGSKNYFILVEYPDTVDDYTVLNPSFTFDVIDMVGSKFVNNSILNRLTSTDTSDWMKVSTSFSNVYALLCAGNYWGTLSELIIQKQVTDFDFNVRLADVITSAALREPAATAYPCVSDVYLTDAEGKVVTTVGNGEYAVHVRFNRDMDQTIDPMVTYGPDDPYTDYSVSGSWASSREWVGTTTVRVLINQGTQYIRVKDAVAADDAWLTTGSDWARFSFQIESSGAEALTLQGEGVKGGVYLNWNQDEYDTMAGFNVYRSDSGYEGTYSRANTSVIAPDAREYTDKNVISGQKYYYYFTVVDTDLKESRPSNVVQCASIDDVAPSIWHTAGKSLASGIAATIVATVTDNVGVNAVKLFYRTSSEAAYKELAMANTNEGTYSAQIPARDMAVGTLEYYIAAADSVNWGYAGSADKPFAVPVEIKVAVASVTAPDAKVGTAVTGTVKGINLSEGMQVRIDGAVIDTTLVSDTELSFTYTPTYMGKKKVEVLDASGSRIAAFSNAIIVADDTVEAFIGSDDIIVENYDQWQHIYFLSNYSGKLDTIDIVLEYPGQYSGFIDFYPYNGWSSSTDNWAEENGRSVVTRTFKMSSGTNYTGGNLMSVSFYMYSGDMPRLRSLRINGCDVRLKSDFSQVTFISEGAYVPVEEIEVSDESKSVALDVGQSFTPDFVVAPNNATKRRSMTYSYDADRLRQNADGTFTVLRSGGTWLYAYCEGKSAEIYVYGKPVPVTSLATEKSSYVGTVGGTITVNLDAEPMISDVWVGVWSYDGTYLEEIASDNNGRTHVFRLKQAGDVQVVFYANDSSENERVFCTVPVEILANTAYTQIDEEIVGLYPNQQFAPTAQVVNAGADGEASINWKSSNTAVARVSSDGVITAVGKGCAVVTASIEGGAKDDTVIVLVGTDSMSYLLGDINMDGSVTAIDSMLALKLAGVSAMADPIRVVADVNGDNVVTLIDAMRILQYVTGAITEF